MKDVSVYPDHPTHILTHSTYLRAILTVSVTAPPALIMAPTAIPSSLTSPPGVPLKKSQIDTQFADRGLGMDQDGSSTPYSATSTAVSENGGDDKLWKSSSVLSPTENPHVALEESLELEPLTPNSEYYSALLASSAPTPRTKVGTTVYGSAIDVLEALAVKHSESVWVYDDAAQVGFGSRLSNWPYAKIHSVQSRQGAGLELAGYSRKSNGRLSVFASTSTLPHLLPNVETIQGNVVVHLATTAPNDDLALGDSLDIEAMKSLAGLSQDWEVVFSSFDAVDTASKVYGREGKFIHVVESTCSARETTSYTFPGPSAESLDDFTITSVASSDVIVTLNGRLAASIPSDKAILVLNTLSPSPDDLAAALSGKTVLILGNTKRDTDCLRTVVLSALYSASGPSKTTFPTIKSILTSQLSAASSHATKTVSFYTSAASPFPQLMAHLFLSSPSLATRMAQFGSASARGVKSTMTLSPLTAPAQPISANMPSDVAWISDANVLKQTDVLSSASANGILVLDLPWIEEEVSVKLSPSEIETIKSKNLRVFLLDLDASAPTNPTKEQVAFLLLYTGSQQLPQGIRRVLEAVYNADLGRDDIEDAQAGLSQLDPSSWIAPELEEGKVEKVKSAWEWDALPGQAGVVKVEEDAKPRLGAYDLAARHLLFREAFAADSSDAPSASFDSLSGPVLNTLRPSTSDETFLVTVSETRRLTPVTYDRNVFHMEFDTAGTGLTYEIGEAIGIHGWNDTAEVLDFCEWYGLDPDAVVTFPNPIRQGTMESRTAFQLLQQNIDLFGRPGKAFYAALSKMASSKADSMTLKFISAPEGAELFKKMAEKETVTFADVLYRFRTARPSIEELVGLIPEIKPRHYSIASSQKAVGDKVELLIVTVDWINSKGKHALLIRIPWPVTLIDFVLRLSAVRSMYTIPRRLETR